MKTILVSYGKTASYKKKKYAFNTKSELKVGDLINSPNYDSVMLVEVILEKAYNYCNLQTGELTDEIKSTECVKIRELVMREEKSDVVYGNIVNEINS